MKLKELKPILYSNHGNLTTCILYDISVDLDIESGCTAEYLIDKYGEREVKRLQADDNCVVITI